MDIDHCIKERRTHRSFITKLVPDSILFEVLDAGRYAPSSGNIQNWRFIIVKDKKNKEVVCNACGKDNGWVTKAPVLVVVCSATDDVKRLYGVRGEALYAIQNCALAIQNILLKAHSMGLAVGWVGDFDETKLTGILDIERGARPQALLGIGYPKQAETPEPREPLENFVFFEKYGKQNVPTGQKSVFPLAQSIEYELEKIKERLHNWRKK